MLIKSKSGTFKLLTQNSKTMANEVINLSKSPVIVRDIYGAVTLAGATGNYSINDEVQGATSGAKATIVEVINPGATPTLRFKYIESSPGVYTAFNGSEAINNNSDTGASTGSSGLVTENTNVTFKSIPNWTRVPDSVGGTAIHIKVTAGDFQFAIDGDPDGDSPVYTTDDELNLHIRDHNVLTFKASAGLKAFVLTV